MGTVLTCYWSLHNRCNLAQYLQPQANIANFRLAKICPEQRHLTRLHVFAAET